MDAKQYAEAARRTVIPYKIHPPHRITDIDLNHSAIGLATENGELMEAALKWCYGGVELDVVNVKEELGDLCWYTALGICSLDLDPQEEWQPVHGYSFTDAQDALLERCTYLTVITGGLLDVVKRKMYYDDQVAAFTKCRGLYVRIVCTIFDIAQIVGLDIEDIWIKNILKLKARYPDKFTDINAIERDVATERKVLEA